MNAKEKWLSLCRLYKTTGYDPNLQREINDLIQEMYPPRHIECQDPIDGKTWYVSINGRPDPDDLHQDQWSWTGNKTSHADHTYQYSFASADEAEAAARDWFRVEDIGLLDTGMPVPQVPHRPGWVRLRIATPSRKHPLGRTIVGRTWYVNRVIHNWMKLPRPEKVSSTDGLRGCWGSKGPVECIYSLTSLDVGFDPRVHDMPIHLPDQIDGLRLENGGRVFVVRGTRDELIAAARQAGYRIAE